MRAVHSCNRHVECRLHLCRGYDGKTSVSWKECCSSARSDDRSSWNTVPRYHLTGREINSTCTIFFYANTGLYLFTTEFDVNPLFRSQVRNETARRYLSSMKKKQPVPFEQKFPNADPLALRLLEKLLAFDRRDRPTAEEVCLGNIICCWLRLYRGVTPFLRVEYESMISILLLVVLNMSLLHRRCIQALAHPYFKGLAKVEREAACLPISKMEFEFERRRVTATDMRELIFREMLEYHPRLLENYKNGRGCKT